MFKFFLGGGWWTLWYIFFYLISLGPSLSSFSELYGWTRVGKPGPESLGAGLGLLLLGGLPVLGYSVLHAIYFGTRTADSRAFLLVFLPVFFIFLLVWVITTPFWVGEASFTGFVVYYTGLAFFVFLNLCLLWAGRQSVSIVSVFGR